MARQTTFMHLSNLLLTSDIIISYIYIYIYTLYSKVAKEMTFDAFKEIIDSANIHFDSEAEIYPMMATDRNWLQNYAIYRGKPKISPGKPKSLLPPILRSRVGQLLTQLT